jgi:hypothetical protein
LRITRKGSSVDKKHKSVGNGSGSVYPRRNKGGKITGYLGSYFGPDGLSGSSTKDMLRAVLHRRL